MKIVVGPVAAEEVEVPSGGDRGVVFAASGFSLNIASHNFRRGNDDVGFVMREFAENGFVLIDSVIINRVPLVLVALGGRQRRGGQPINARIPNRGNRSRSTVLIRYISARAVGYSGRVKRMSIRRVTRDAVDVVVRCAVICGAYL
jgi:hypothetical protein